MLAPRGEQGRAERVSDREGHGRGEDSGEAAPRNSSAEGRVPASTAFSEEVSGGACSQEPTTPERQTTTTPAQTVPGGQEESEPSVPRAVGPPHPARRVGAGLGRSASER